MIVVRLTGGLGNQLFQYAAGRRLALRLGVELVLEDSFYENPPANATPRIYELDRFHTHPVCRRLREIFSVPGQYVFIRQRLAKFEEAVFNLPSNVFNVFMDGYWQ